MSTPWMKSPSARPADVVRSAWEDPLGEDDLAYLAYLRTLRPCSRCGGREWRKRADDGRWLCSCWWTWGKQLGLREGAAYPE